MTSTDNHQSVTASDLSEHQIAFANSLGVDWESAASVRDAVLQIEQNLGQKSLREMARWFLLSVLQHLHNADWGDIDNSGLENELHYELADHFLSSDEYKQSLLTVLKDPRFRFTLLGFAKGRNPSRRVLSTSTKAYRQAREILLENGLVDTSQVSRRGRRPARKTKFEETPINRRAARRSQLSPELSVKINVVSPTEKTSNSSAMSEEEFAELEQALDKSEMSEGQAWTYETNEERLSLFLGILGGACFCLLVLWMLP